MSETNLKKVTEGNVYPIATTRFQRELLANPRRWWWANVMNLPSENVEEYGIYNAMELDRMRAIEQIRREKEELAKLEDKLLHSEHLPSSGQSNRMTRKENEEHYRRKGKLEEKKEAMRRRYWKLKYPGARESSWERRQASRKAKRNAFLATRKAAKAALRATRKAGKGSSNRNA